MRGGRPSLHQAIAAELRRKHAAPCNAAITKFGGMKVAAKTFDVL